MGSLSDALSALPPMDSPLLSMPLFRSSLTDDDIAQIFNTPLSPEEEKAFQVWKKKYAPKDSGYDYDLRGAYKAGFRPDNKTHHWGDRFKKPNHPTFSDQSQWASLFPERAGSWSGEDYTPSPLTNAMLMLGLGG